MSSSIFVEILELVKSLRFTVYLKITKVRLYTAYTYNEIIEGRFCNNVKLVLRSIHVLRGNRPYLTWTVCAVCLLMDDFNINQSETLNSDCSARWTAAVVPSECKGSLTFNSTTQKTSCLQIPFLQYRT